ncbi:ATP-binding protein [Rhizobium beringeri]
MPCWRPCRRGERSPLQRDWRTRRRNCGSPTRETAFPEERLIRIFEPFYTTKQAGTGLGLSIARAIIETYGGTICADNRPEGGAVFRMVLPLAHGQERSR